MKELMKLDAALWGNPLHDWLVSLGIAVAILLTVALLKPILIQRLSVLARRTSTVLDDAIVKALQATRLWLIAFVAIYLGGEFLTLPAKAEKLIGNAAAIALFVQIGFWIGTLLEVWISHSRTRALEVDASAATSLSALSFVGKLVLWALILLFALDNLGVNVTAMVAGLGIGGIAVALAAQNILGDLFASLSIVIDKPFVLGDFIIVEDYMGAVESIGIKTTRIRSLGGEQIVFSNSDLLKARLRNYKRMRERRVVCGFGVLYQTTPEQLEKIPGIMKRIIETQPLTRFDRAHFQKFGESSLDFEVVYWMLDPDYNKYMDTQQAINLALMRAFAKEGIGFAYPTRSIFVEAPVKIESALRQAAS